jgi:hypothetical protein
MAENLLGCPFCGGEASLTRALGESWVRCMTCDSTSPMTSRDYRAVELWNTRAEPQSPALDVEADLEGLEKVAREALVAGNRCLQTYLDAFDPPTVLALLSEVRALRGANEQLFSLLKELHAMVLGECPSLLDEDSGGSARLGMEIEAQLSALRSLVEEEKREEVSCADTCADGSLPVLNPDALPDDLAPFVQGYIKALLAEPVSPSLKAFKGMQLGFADLAPEARTAILKDCEAWQCGPRRWANTAVSGSEWYRTRQRGDYPGFPPLVAFQEDDGKVYLRESAR